MLKKKPNAYILISYFLFGAGLFSVIYPAIVKLFTPARVFAPHHLYFLIAGFALLLVANILFWIGRSRLKAE